jgi:hypothetical protein
MWKHYGGIEICGTCGTGQLVRKRDGMIRTHQRDLWLDGRNSGMTEWCPGSNTTGTDLVAESKARANRVN